MKFLAATLVFAFSLNSLAQEVVVDVTLNPMGDFKAKTAAVKGEAIKKGDEFTASNITVNLKTLKTGIEGRDKHTQKYLETEKFPEAVLLSASGKGGKGKGRIKIRGVEKDIVGTYKVEGKQLKAKFDLKLADFGIKDINYMSVGVEDTVVLNVSVPVK